MKSTWRWLQDRPFLCSLIVLLAVVIPGFIRITDLTQENNKTTKALSVSQNANRDLISCLVSYAVDMTESLQQRDGVSSIAREASIDLWEQIETFFKEPQAAPRREFLRTINRYQRVLRTVSATSTINPYPNLEPCLRDVDFGDDWKTAEAMRILASQLDRVVKANTFKLVSSKSLGFPAAWDDKCLGRPVTIYGTTGSDFVVGTDSDDVIFTYRGNDIVVSGRGEDRVCTRRGGDVINGGQNHDAANCGKGYDIAIQVETQFKCE